MMTAANTQDNIGESDDVLKESLAEKRRVKKYAKKNWIHGK